MLISHAAYLAQLEDAALRADYTREAYGDPCPVHGDLRWGADCPRCATEWEAEALADDLAEVEAAERHAAALAECVVCGAPLGPWGPRACAACVAIIDADGDWS